MKSVPENHVQDSGELQFIAKSVGLLALLTGLAYLRVVGVETLAAWRAHEDIGAILLLVLLIVAILGLVLSWWREGLGGFIAAVSAVGVGILAYSVDRHNRYFSAFAYSSPFMITGILFLCCWWRHHRRGGGN